MLSTPTPPPQANHALNVAVTSIRSVEQRVDTPGDPSSHPTTPTIHPFSLRLIAAGHALPQERRPTKRRLGRLSASRRRRQPHDLHGGASTTRTRQQQRYSCNRASRAIIIRDTAGRRVEPSDVGEGQGQREGAGEGEREERRCDYYRGVLMSSTTTYEMGTGRGEKVVG